MGPDDTLPLLLELVLELDPPDALALRAGLVYAADSGRYLAGIEVEDLGLALRLAARRGRIGERPRPPALGRRAAA